jgi:hypothetical protein
MLPRKILVDDQNLRTMKTHEIALMIVVVAAMAVGHSDQIARIGLNDKTSLKARIDLNGKISRFREKKTKRPSSSYQNLSITSSELWASWPKPTSAKMMKMAQ